MSEKQRLQDKSSRVACPEISKKAKGVVDYNMSVRNRRLGYHHCRHTALKSSDFPIVVSSPRECSQVSVSPVAVDIYPPLPHSGNENLEPYDRPNPYYVPPGSECTVTYSQYYF